MSTVNPGSPLRSHIVRLLAATLALSFAGPPLTTRAANALILDQPVAIRPTSPQIPSNVVSFVAQSFPSTRLDRAHYPELGDFTPRQIVEVLCGGVRDDYMNELVTRFHLNEKELDKPIGPKGYDINWPACLFVKTFHTPATYTAKSGDTLSDLRMHFTGISGSSESNAQFFDIPLAVASAKHLSAGTKLKIPYETASSIWTSDFKDQVQGLYQLATSGSPQGGSNTFVSFKPAPDRGRIVTFVDKSTPTGLTEPAECSRGARDAPFDAKNVAAAYQYSLTRKQQVNPGVTRVNVFVIDNGFFGVRPTAAGSITSGQHFPQQYFDTFNWGSGGLIGPTTAQDAGDVYPINYQNGMAVADNISGHGTHVTGLILGGPAWVPYQTSTFTISGQPIIKIAQMNVGKGSEFLLPNSDQLLARTFSLLHTPYIVNMSITYNGGTSSSGAAASFAFMNETSPIPTPHLFVVAAGNDSLPNNLSEYPAALGGNSPTVLTVAALTPQGRLTQFSNKGMKVDVAAPGCHVRSWINDGDAGVTLSGTSQAAPTVTFEAVLMRSLIDAGASDLKMRIEASGNLLAPDDQSSLATPIAVNLRKAMYVYDDYIRYHDDHGVHEELGSILNISGISCPPPVSTFPFTSILAFKRGQPKSYVFLSAPADTQITACVPLLDSNNGQVVLAKTVDAKNGYAALSGRTQISLDSLDEFIRRGPPMQGAH